MSFHIHPPASDAVNSHHIAAERHNVAWVQRHSPGMAVDSDMLHRLQRTRFSRLAAFTYPRVGPDELALITNWITWLFLHDDFYCDDNDADEKSLIALHEGVLALLVAIAGKFLGAYAGARASAIPSQLRMCAIWRNEPFPNGRGGDLWPRTRQPTCPRLGRSLTRAMRVAWDDTPSSAFAEG